MVVETISSASRLTTPHGAWLEIRLDRLIKNLERLRSVHGAQVALAAVIKANAYGHGIVPVAKALEGKAEFLGLASLKEGCLLREQGARSPLLIFGRIFPEEIPLALQMKLTLTLSSFEEAREISEEAVRNRETAVCHIKIDTGMGRLGIPFAQALAEVEKISKLPALNLEGIYTHFATAEKVHDPFGDEQLNRFEELLRALQRKGITFRFRHAANSAGTLRFRTPWLNLVRPGIALYGVYPGPSFQEKILLEPVLSFKSRIAFIKRIAAGDSVSYGREFIAARPTTIALLPVGYSHGYPFRLSGKGEVLCRGRRFPIAGRICMDAVLIDLGETADLRVGDEVTLLGEEGAESIRAEELAARAGTIPYEILTRMEPSLPRYFRP